jgi:hypothetical protein
MHPFRSRKINMRNYMIKTFELHELSKDIVLTIEKE